jgi:hypothetical protein
MSDECTDRREGSKEMDDEETCTAENDERARLQSQ